jgi:hypothetical protein
MNIELTTDEIKRGYRNEEGGHSCLLCGERFLKGEVFPIGGRFFEAEKAVSLHMEEKHADYLSSLIDGDTKYNSFTENQRTLLRLFAEGLTDKEIAVKMGVTPSTVRNQKFQFREKAKQYRWYLAVYERVFETAKGDDIVPVHENARQVDERYVITEEERDTILRTAFSSLDPPVLIRFPRKEKKKLVILTRIAAQFEKGRDYTEREVNSILEAIFDDYVTLRRYLIEYGFLDRERNGSRYWVK